MPGSVATFAACSRTFWSIARISDSLPKSTTGTRMAPLGSMRHWVASTRVSAVMSMILKTADDADARRLNAY